MNSFIEIQKKFEKELEHKDRKNNGVFFTNNTEVIDLILNNITINKYIFDKKILEPSVGNGIFLISLIIKISLKYNNKDTIHNFIENNLYFNDISKDSVNATKENIKDLFYVLFNEKYMGTFNDSVNDFTIKENNISLFETFDYIIGNPPYVSLYGRRDQKKNEEQREYYLKNYNQFPDTLKNGKINLVMIFIEQGINLLKKDGVLSFIIDIAFFETAYLHLRKYLLENTQILEFIYDIDVFEEVASGQVIITIKKGYKSHNKIKIINFSNNNKNFEVEQDKWNNDKDNYKFRIDEYCNISNNILKKVFNKNDKTLKQMYPKKNLRTGVMLLNMENEFVYKIDEKYHKTCKSYPYYIGSKSIKNKYSKPITEVYFYFDENKKEEINNRLQDELKLKGIKNKKRLGFGESIIYDNPKVYIRQSAKEIIATYDENYSCCNNSLYIFTLRDNSKESKIFLNFLTGFLNSKLITFIAQKRRIIRYEKGKQPQIKISDLYEINIPKDILLIEKISELVTNYIKNKNELTLEEIDNIILKYYGITKNEEKYIEESIKDFLL